MSDEAMLVQYKIEGAERAATQAERVDKALRAGGDGAVRQYQRAMEQITRLKEAAVNKEQRLVAAAAKQEARERAQMQKEAERTQKAAERQSAKDAKAQAAERDSQQKALLQADAQRTALRQSYQLRQEKNLAQQRKRDQSEADKAEKERVEAGKKRFKELVESGSGKGGFMEKVGRVISSSRLGVSSNGLEIMPLVGQLTGLLGEFGGPAGMAVTAITAMAQAASHARDELNQFKLNMYIGGGTKTETSEAEIIGHILGMDAKDVIGHSRAFADRITSDPYAMGYAGNAGISETGVGPNGKIDKVENLFRMIDALKRMSDADAIRAARATGTEDFLPLRELSDERYAQVRRLAQEEGGMFDPEQQKRLYNDRAGNEMAHHYAGTAINRTISAIDDWLNRNLESSSGMVPGGSVGRGGRSPEMANAQDRHTTAVAANTAAIMANTQVMQGVYGGGERARGAVPTAYLGAITDSEARHQMSKRTLAMGAFGL